MNAIHQIRLKLQMGIHPAVEVPPEILRAMWWQLLREQSRAAKCNHEPAWTMHADEQRWAAGGIMKKAPGEG